MESGTKAHQEPIADPQPARVVEQLLPAAFDLHPTAAVRTLQNLHLHPLVGLQAIAEENPSLLQNRDHLAFHHLLIDRRADFGSRAPPEESRDDPAQRESGKDDDRHGQRERSPAG